MSTSLLTRAESEGGMFLAIFLILWIGLPSACPQSEGDCPIVKLDHSIRLGKFWIIPDSLSTTTSFQEKPLSPTSIE